MNLQAIYEKACQNDAALFVTFPVPQTVAPASFDFSSRFETSYKMLTVLNPEYERLFSDILRSVIIDGKDFIEEFAEAVGDAEYWRSRYTNNEYDMIEEKAKEFAIEEFSTEELLDELYRRKGEI